MTLTTDKFNAQKMAHRLLREAHDYRARAGSSLPLVFRDVRAPDKAGAHLRLTAEADGAGISLNHPRVSLVRSWIDMSSGVQI